MGFELQPDLGQIQELGPATPASVARMAACGAGGAFQGNIWRDMSRQTSTQVPGLMLLQLLCAYQFIYIDCQTNP